MAVVDLSANSGILASQGWYRWLLLAHAAAFALHFAMAFAGVVFVLSEGGARTALIFYERPQWNATACSADFGASNVPICPVVGAAPRDVSTSEIDMSALLITTQLITASAHALQAWALYRRNRAYLSMTAVGIKLGFWLEYSLTAPAIASLAAYFGGFIDLREQLLVWASQCGLMYSGLLLDLIRFGIAGHEVRDTTRLLRLACLPVLLCGFYSVFAIWVPPLVELAKVTSEAPAWVFYVVLLECVLYVSFGVAQAIGMAPFLVYGRMDSERLIAIEHLGMIALSFCSKATLNAAFSACVVFGKCGGD